MQRDKDIKEHDIQVTERGDSQSCYSISGSQDRRGGSENFGRTEMQSLSPLKFSAKLAPS